MPEPCVDSQGGRQGASDQAPESTSVVGLCRVWPPRPLVCFIMLVTPMRGEEPGLTSTNPAVEQGYVENAKTTLHPHTHPGSARLCLASKLRVDLPLKV